MPRNGTGQYAAPASTWNLGVNGVTALTADYNAQLDDIEAAITQSVSADGQTPMTGNLPMGNNKITGLTAGVATTDAANVSQTVGRLLRVTAFYRIAGVQNVSVDGGAATTTGATTFTALPGTVFAIVEGVGAGGGSGGNPTTTAAQQAFSSGGGGGSFGIGRFPAPLSAIPITVGAAGAAGAAGGNGGNGGATTFGALMSCPGGPGSVAGVAGGGVGSTAGTTGAAAPTGANIIGMVGGTSLQVLSAALGFISSQTAGVSGSGTPNSYGSGAFGKYNGVSTASPQPGIAAPEGGRLIIWEYA